MSWEDIPILVVDDAKYSSAVITKALTDEGFSNVRCVNDGFAALDTLENRSAQILIADWVMPAMDGLELTRRVKRLDEENGHFTYVMLLTGREDFEGMLEAFDTGVDDFLNKHNLRAELQPRIIAAQRIAARQNELLRTNKLLRKKVRELSVVDLIDPVTGLGNRRFTIERLTAAMEQAESRRMAACLLLVGVDNVAALTERYGPPAVDELMSGIGSKIRTLVRPLDLVTRPEPGIFAVITLHPSIDECTSSTFQRIFDGLYLNSFKTSEAYIPVSVGISITAADAQTGFPHPRQLMRQAVHALGESFESGQIEVQRAATLNEPVTAAEL
jgi:diguanylate cyclase (GGDEF)-like protein